MTEIGSDQGAVVTDVSGDTTVTVTYLTASNETKQFEVDGVRSKLSDEHQNWAFVPRSSLPPELEAVGSDPDAGVVTVGERALVGDLSSATEEIDDQPVMVVAPTGMDVDPARKAYFLDEFLSPYSFDPNPNGQVTLVIAPSALPSAGMMYGDSGYIAQTAFWDGTVGSVWIHEYVHSQRSFALAPEMRWFSEASATYYSYRVMEEQYDPVTDEDVRERLMLEDTYPETTLSNPAEWTGTRANYHRGAKLLYVVDAEVRAGSDGERTLVDVYRAMNRHDGPITVADFVRIVEATAGNDEQWLHDAITTDDDLNESVDRASAEFEG
ncbi:hypothetical protein [Halanaeroarchaeum sp. HSR-CO]|uniref:hypothetical protein n=1 Tax=Halanaeroarchaeum sp. HSR-CO TaxID=2866382 RepID=UPI00217DEE32|nr:hypothetical protein [Halanaeroarchaeum sp. HSR-CO]